MPPALELERLGAGKPVVLVVPETSVRLSQLVQELAAAQLVRTSTPELLSDPTARTELTGRIEELDRQVASEVGRTFDPHRSEWLVAGERLELSTPRAVSSVLSALCDAHFSGAPPIRNELLNRRALSTSAARARRNLMEAMILRGDVARLGLEGNPPEVSMYRSLLEQHGFHRQRGGAWRFGPPGRALRPLWTAVQEFLRASETGRRPLTDLYDRLRRPPFGIKDGPLPVIVVAALLARASRVAVYERGSFVPAWTPSHAERLLRSPDGFEVRQCRIDSKRREVLECLAGRLLPSTARKPSLLGVVRGLVQFVAKLTPYARRTLRISGRARDIRETLVRAREPAQLVFDDLPAACGCPPFGSSPKNDRHRIDDFVAALDAGLREVRDAYPALLARSAAALANHLNLPGDLAELAAELRSRASLVESAAVEPRLRSFVVRASDAALGPDDMLASLLTQLADKPPPEWSDADEDQFEVRLAYVARAFRGAESLLVAPNGPADGQPLLRLSVARRGRPEQERVLPLRAAEESRIAALRDRILDTVRQPRAEAAACDREQALAALALAAESLIDGADRSQPERGGQ